jgi:hypothetical protein
MTAVPMTAVAVGTTSMLRLDCGRAATATPEYVSASYTNQWRIRTRPDASPPMLVIAAKERERYRT